MPLQVKSFAAPTSEAVSLVTTWLQGTAGTSNITQIGTFGEWISFSINLSTANELLDAKFENFVHVETGTILIRTLSYAVPLDLVQYIDLVHPTTSFVVPIPKKQKLMSARKGSHNSRANSAPASCNDAVTPACLQDLYGIPSTPATQSSNRLAVSSFMDSDIEVRKVFWSNFDFNFSTLML